MTSDRMMTKEEYDKKCKALICLHRLSFIVCRSARAFSSNLFCGFSHRLPHSA